MPPSATVNVNWDDFTELWSIPEAEAFLSQATSEPLPKRGRVQQLLVRTQQILSSAAEAEAIHFKAAEAAVQARAVVLLARLMHVLQQSPSMDVTAVIVHRPFSSVWYCVVYTLVCIVETIQKQRVAEMRSQSQEAEVEECATVPELTPIKTSCMQQLDEAEGACLFAVCINEPCCFQG